jgi:3-oxoacyl-[acyl-carrier-protein] synthase II
MKNKLPVITGVGIFTPMGKNKEEFIDSLINKKFFHIKSYRSENLYLSELWSSIFNNDDMLELGSSRYDKSLLFIEKALEEAIKDSGVNLNDYDKSRIAVISGNANVGLDSAHKLLLDKNIKLYNFFSFNPAIQSAYIAKKISAEGINLTFVSACAASNTALAYASNLIENDKADICFVCGADFISEAILAGFYSLRAVIDKINAPFSIPDGLNLGEGAGVIVLEKDNKVKNKKNYGSVLGYGISGDAYHATAPDPNGLGFINSMNLAIDDAKIDKKDIEYVSAHGTGTLINDIIEASAIHKVFGDNISLSAPKSYLGHTLGASGIIEVIFTLLSLSQNKLPPTLRFSESREGLPKIDYIPNNFKEAKEENIFLSNNFAFGGNNSSLIVSDSVKDDYKKNIVYNNLVIADCFFMVGNLTSNNSLVDIFEERIFDSILPDTSSFSIKKTRRMPNSVLYSICSTASIIKDSSFSNDNMTGLIVGVNSAMPESLEGFVSSLIDNGVDMASSLNFSLSTANSLGGQISIYHKIIGYNTSLAPASNAFVVSSDFIQSGKQSRIIVLTTDSFTDISMNYLNSSISSYIKQSSGHDKLSEGSVAILLQNKEYSTNHNQDYLCNVLSYISGKNNNIVASFDNYTLLEQIVYNSLFDAKINKEEIDMVILTGIHSKKSHNMLEKIHYNLFKDKNVIYLEKFFGYMVNSNLSLAIAMGSRFIKEQAVPVLVDGDFKVINKKVKYAIIIGIDSFNNCHSVVLSK